MAIMSAEEAQEKTTTYKTKIIEKYITAHMDDCIRQGHGETEILFHRSLYDSSIVRGLLLDAGYAYVDYDTFKSDNPKLPEAWFTDDEYANVCDNNVCVTVHWKD